MIDWLWLIPAFVVGFAVGDITTRVRIVRAAYRGLYEAGIEPGDEFVIEIRLATDDDDEPTLDPEA